jgi:hypothetical protein
VGLRSCPDVLVDIRCPFPTGNRTAIVQPGVKDVDRLIIFVRIILKSPSFIVIYSSPFSIALIFYSVSVLRC